MESNFSQRLAKAIHASGLPKKAIAEAVGVQPPALSRWLNQGVIPEAKYLTALSSALDVDVNWLLTGEGPTPSARMVELVEGGVNESPASFNVRANVVPLLSWAHAGVAASYEELPKDWQEMIPTTCRSPDAFALEIEGDSMQPYCFPGDIAIIMPHEAPRNGRLAVVKLKDDGVVLRRYSRAGGVIRLTPHNPVYLPADHQPRDFQWIYPVHSIFRREWI